ncbi:MAG: hypothetical protein RR470_05235 [Vagococcus sp.]|uniref:hypothetical protein n=1 Tax=Vagococcus sp. TaxID=1933889 RepID=UPI002FC92AC6
MLHLLVDRWFFILLALPLILLGIFMIVSLFKIKQKSKLLVFFLLITGLCSLTLGLYSLLFIVFFGVNT